MNKMLKVGSDSQSPSQREVNIKSLRIFTKGKVVATG